MILRHLGRRPCAAVMSDMQAHTDARGPEDEDELWVVEHDPVFTQGLAGRGQHVLAPGEKLRSDQKGLVFAATPASDFICGTLQLAAGMNVHVFTTGRGTPYGLAECPVIKVATRSDLARRWHDLMDVNAGRIADGQISVEEAGRELFDLLLAVASGQRTWAEQWKLHNALVLFNPAPIT